MEGQSIWLGWEEKILCLEAAILNRVEEQVEEYCPWRAWSEQRPHKVQGELQSLLCNCRSTKFYVQIFPDNVHQRKHTLVLAVVAGVVSIMAYVKSNKIHAAPQKGKRRLACFNPSPASEPHPAAPKAVVISWCNSVLQGAVVASLRL